MMKYIHLSTMGCPKNMTDSRRLLERLLAAGFVHLEDPREADIILINTCGFIKDATQESIGEILAFAGLRSEGWQGRLVVLGCMAKRFKDDLLREIPEMDAIFGVGDDDLVLEYCKSAEARKCGSAEARKCESAEAQKLGSAEVKAETDSGKGQKAGAYIKAKSGKGEAISEMHTSELPGVTASYAYLKISDGCDKKCTFCVIPSIRGRLRSIEKEAVLAEAERFVRAGIKELILVAQDITNYGKEWGDYGLVDLLNDMSAIEGDFRIRLLYLYPTEINEALLRCIAENEKICKYLDIPLQHSEDRVLRLMGRRGSRGEYIKLIRTIRRTIPGVALRTTFITGFPSETEEEFQGMADFIEEMRFDRLGVFSYSREEGSAAAQLKGQLPEKVKLRRLDELMKRQAMISLEKNREMEGRRYRALVDEVDRAAIICRLESHTPEIDGVVIIERTADDAAADQIKAGDFIEVEIEAAYDYDLKGILAR